MTKSSLTIKDLVEFVIKNRYGKAFKDWSSDSIAIAFRDAIKNNCLVYSLNSNGEINGVLLAERFDDYKVLHINNILTTEKGIVKKFLSKFFEWYGKDWDLQGYRHENLKRWANTNQFIHKIQQLT